MDDGYSLQRVFEDFRDEQRRSNERIERKVDELASTVANIEVKQAQQAGKLGVLVVILGAAATSVGAIISAVVLQGIQK